MAIPRGVRRHPVVVHPKPILPKRVVPVKPRIAAPAANARNLRSALNLRGALNRIGLQKRIAAPLARPTVAPPPRNFAAMTAPVNAPARKPLGFLQRGLQAVGGALQRGAQAVGGVMQRGAQAVGGVVRAAVPAVGGAVQRALPAAGGVIGRGFQGIGHGLAVAGRSVRHAATSVGRGIGHGIAAVGTTISRGVQRIGRGLAATARAVGHRIAATVRAVGRGIAAATRAVGRAAAATGRAIGRGAAAVGRGLARAGRAVGRAAVAAERGIAVAARAAGRALASVGKAVIGGLAVAGKKLKELYFPSQPSVDSTNRQDQGLQFSETRSADSLAYDANVDGVYRFPDGRTWRVAEMQEDKSTGFRAVVLKPTDPTDRRTIVSYAGTDPLSARDWGTDIKQGVGGLPRQYQQALDLARRYEGRDTILTGHSLGGGLAGYAAIQTGMRATAINSAALAPQALGGNPLLHPSVKNRPNITQYNVPSEVLTKLDNMNPLDARPGNRIEIPGDYSAFNPASPILNHMMGHTATHISDPVYVGQYGQHN